MSNDNHQLIPIVDMVPVFWQSPKKMLHVPLVWPLWVCKILTNQKIVIEVDTYNRVFVHEIAGHKFESQDSYSDDDISAISDSDSNILGLLRRPMISNF